MTVPGLMLRLLVSLECNIGKGLLRLLFGAKISAIRSRDGNTDASAVVCSTLFTAFCVGTQIFRKCFCASYSMKLTTSIKTLWSQDSQNISDPEIIEWKVTIDL